MEIERTCPVCASVYYADDGRLKFGRQTTCSRICSYQLRASAATVRIDLKCSTCGREIRRCPSGVKSKHEGNYCSRACHYAGRSAGTTRRIVSAPYVITPEGVQAHRECRKRAVATRKERGNYGQSDATRVKLSAATSKAIAEGRFPRVSKIEEIVAQELTSLGVEFRRQVGLRNPTTGTYCACLDFWLPARRAALEVNGTFWHADPRVYDHANLSPAQVRTVERYGRKVNLLRELGIELIEVWEADIHKTPKDAVSLALGCGLA